MGGPKDPEKKQAYAREWYRQRRLRGLEYLGGACVKCGSKSDLELDHIDPTTKDPLLRKTNKKTGNGQLWQWSWERITKELDKCQLLCHSCHVSKSTYEGSWNLRYPNK